MFKVLSRCAWSRGPAGNAVHAEESLQRGRTVRFSINDCASNACVPDKETLKWGMAFPGGSGRDATPETFVEVAQKAKRAIWMRFGSQRM